MSDENVRCLLPSLGAYDSTARTEAQKELWGLKAGDSPLRNNMKTSVRLSIRPALYLIFCIVLFRVHGGMCFRWLAFLRKGRNKCKEPLLCEPEVVNCWKWFRNCEPVGKQIQKRPGKWIWKHDCQCVRNFARVRI